METKAKGKGKKALNWVLTPIMSTTSENNKRIARNTMFLYFRQILVMAVSLYTVRVVLDVLGEEDYGIYNVVGGFVAMFNICLLYTSPSPRD